MSTAPFIYIVAAITEIGGRFPSGSDSRQVPGRTGTAQEGVLLDDMLGRQLAWVGGIGFHLNGRVADTKRVTHVLANVRYERIAGMAVGHDQMNG